MYVALKMEICRTFYQRYVHDTLNYCMINLKKVSCRIHAKIFHAGINVEVWQKKRIEEKRIKKAKKKEDCTLIMTVGCLVILAVISLEASRWCMIFAVCFSSIDYKWVCSLVVYSCSEAKRVTAVLILNHCKTLLRGSNERAVVKVIQDPPTFFLLLWTFCFQ